MLGLPCEWVGDFKPGGRKWQPKGQPTPVQVYDVINLAIGNATPYGIDDVTRYEGWVTMGSDHDTAPLAVATIRRWWQERGRVQSPTAPDLYIVADGGGSHGSRVRLGKAARQRFAIAEGLRIHVSHLPPGTSQGSKIEPRLFSVISRNWRAAH